MRPTTLTLHKLFGEVAASAYVIRHRIQLQHLTKLWTALSDFIRASIERRKGVLIPSLGTFYVLTAVLAQERAKPAFELLDRRFSGVSQDISHLDRFSKKNGVLNVNYHHLSTIVGLHRSSCQRILKNVMERLALHINSRNDILIPFPKVGTLLKNKAGRIQFKFEENLLIALKPNDQAHSRMEGRSSLLSPLDPQPEVCPISEAKRIEDGFKSLENDPPVEDGRSDMVLCNELDAIWKICKSADKNRTGSILRMELEKGLQKECRRLLQQVDGLTLLDLLQMHTSSQNGTLLYYGQFLSSLKEIAHQQDCQVMEIHSNRNELNASSDSLSDNEEVEAEGSENGVQTPYISQNRGRLFSRKECDAFNDYHFRRLMASRGEDPAPKIGIEPRTIEETMFHSDRPKERTTRTAPARTEKVSELEDLVTNEKATTIQGNAKALLLRESWKQQVEEKAKLMQEFQSAEEKWPYGPIRRPHIRIPATAPRYIHAHYVRPYDAPNHLSVPFINRTMNGSRL